MAGFDWLCVVHKAVSPFNCVFIGNVVKFAARKIVYNLVVDEDVKKPTKHTKNRVIVTVIWCTRYRSINQVIA